MVKIMAEQVAVMDSIPPPEDIPQNDPVQIITQPDLQDIITKDEPDLTDIVQIKDEIADVISSPDFINNPNAGLTRFIPAGNDIADVISSTDLINIPPNNLIPNPEDIGLILSVPTGDRQTDEKNYDDYLDTLQQIRPDLFITDDQESDNESGNDVVVIPKVELKAEPDFMPFVDVDGNILIKTEPDETPTDIFIGSDIESSDDDDDRTIPYVGDSDTETVSYATIQRDKRNEIYRKRAKKRALKTLAKKRAKKLQSIKKKNNNKKQIFVPTDVPIINEDVLIKTETDDTPLVDVYGDILIKTEIDETPTDILISSDIESSDDETQTIPYVGDSDTETVTYATIQRDKRNEIYRKRAKKRALKMLAKKRAKKLQSIKKKNNKKTHFLLPTDVPITSNDPIEILANPNVSTILPAQIKTEDDFNDIDNVTDPQIVWDEDNTDLVPLEFDTDKIVMTEDGDVILTEPDNMQVEEKQLVPLSNDTIMLPPEENMTDIISTRNIVLKRKQPDLTVAQIKKTKNKTDISLPDIIKHPIFRKMEKEKKSTDRLTRILSQGKPLEIRIKDELLAIEDSPSLPALEAPPTLPALMPPSASRPLATVDAETMQRMPWVDFNVVLDKTEKCNREQVIFDILQANMPNSGDDIYYVYQDPETNVFSIKTDEIAEEIQDFVENIRIIGAKLALEDLSKKERNYLLKVRSLKIKELRKTYGATVLADVLDNKFSESEKNELEDQVVEMLKELNQDEDKYYFEFNEETQEFEILLDSEVRINAIVFAVMQIDKVIRDVNTTHTRKLDLMTEKDKLLDYLKEKGAKTLANSLR